MNVEIIVIGDELLIGQVTDTNSGWIARELNHIGWEVTEITTVRDRSREITDALNSSFGRVDVVLMTGGLGPTQDDITKQTLCDYFGGKLVFDESVFANVEAIFRRRKLTMNDSTRNQAYVPNMCTVIQNPVGTAPVMWFERNGKVLVSMPGVPTEMKTVMKEVVISRLREYFQDHSSILHRTCLVKDFTESRLSETLSDFEAQLPACIKLAYLPTPGVIRLRLTARGDEESYLQKIIDDEFFKLRTILGSHLDRFFFGISNEATSIHYDKLTRNFFRIMSHLITGFCETMHQSFGIHQIFRTTQRNNINAIFYHCHYTKIRL